MYRNCTFHGIEFSFFHSFFKRFVLIIVADLKKILNSFCCGGAAGQWKLLSCPAIKCGLQRAVVVNDCCSTDNCIYNVQ